jgi:hypothetical protein
MIKKETEAKKVERKRRRIRPAIIRSRERMCFIILYVKIYNYI